MTKVLWAGLAATAVLWPARLAGPLDGAPLDQPFEAVGIGVLLTWLAVSYSAILDRSSFRVLVVALLVWKAATAALLAQDGWCLRFESPLSLYRGDVRVPHSWDIRADWRSRVPQCSAVMTEGFWILERFPAWFYNLAPADVGRQPTPADRPPNVTLWFTLHGYLQADRSGILQIEAGEDVKAGLRIDDRDVSSEAASRGITLDPGLHRVSIQGDLVRSHWSLRPLWNGRDVWQGSVATMAPPSALDRWIRPWGRTVPPLIVGGLIVLGLLALVRRVRSPLALAYGASASLVTVLIVLSGQETLLRVAPVCLVSAAALPLARRLHNVLGLSLLVGLPMLAMISAIGAPQAGIFTWYSGGDDWWMFQRFSYRIFLQGYWLEGGQHTFWFQPLYRWIVGGLHLVFGDSSVGELFWDAAAALTCATYAFHITRVVAGFRWGLVAATTTLALFTLGPSWYLVGRGLSEFSSAGLICGAALFALRARHGSWPFAVMAGVLATLGFYTRLNNLPMAMAVAAFALPVRQTVGDLFEPSRWWPRASREVLLGVIGMIAVGMWLFTARTWYYTNRIDMFFGTTAALNSVWQASDGPLQAVQRVGSSVMMLLTMNDPPRFDVRALPVLGGFAIAVLAVARVKALARLPLNAVVFCLAGIVGALVARGTAYPGRFSIHLIPVTVTIAVSAASLVVRSRQP
ncbi:MAG: hypothetical protein ACRD2N_18795 [Vicinamibacterales bacterium]